MSEHLLSCAIGYPERFICPSPLRLHDEAVGVHWWSGWPGAYCMKCHASDPHEECLADCECQCHEHDFDELTNA